MNIVLFGAPGSGKGSQAALISKEYGLPHISTGDLFRQNIADGTELGLTAKEYINKGQLVPDKITLDMVKSRLNEPDCKNGFILDGFPRNLAQARALDKITKIDVVIFIDVSASEIEIRAINRRICPSCGKIFSMLDKYVEFCDACGAGLIQREDDNIEVVRTRMKNYLEASVPLIEYYKKKNILETVLSGKNANETYVSVREILEKLRNPKRNRK